MNKLRNTLIIWIVKYVSVIRAYITVLSALEDIALKQSAEDIKPKTIKKKVRVKAWQWRF